MILLMRGGEEPRWTNSSGAPSWADRYFTDTRNKQAASLERKHTAKQNKNMNFYRFHHFTHIVFEADFFFIDILVLNRCFCLSLPSW